MQVKTIVPATLYTDVQRGFGFNIWEDASAAAEWEFRALSATGQVVSRIHLAADESALIVLPKSVFFDYPGGLWIKEVSGSITGVVYY